MKNDKNVFPHFKVGKWFIVICYQNRFEFQNVLVRLQKSAKIMPEGVQKKFFTKVDKGV